MSLNKKSAHAKDLRTGLAPMQHRHFATIATILRDMRTPNELGESAPHDRIAEYFASRLSETNSNFDRDRFLAACQ